METVRALQEARPDGFLLAGRYTLLDHSRALQRVMPDVAARGLGIVVGGPYSSGALVGGPNFEYAPAGQDILNKVSRIRTLAERHGVSVKAAGLHFALAHPAVAAVIPGASRPERIAEDRAAYQEVVPDAFWSTCGRPVWSVQPQCSRADGETPSLGDARPPQNWCADVVTDGHCAPAADTDAEAVSGHSKLGRRNAVGVCSDVKICARRNSVKAAIQRFAEAHK